MSTKKYRAFLQLKCEVPFREKSVQKRAARWQRLNKFHSRNIDQSGTARSDAMFDDMINAQMGQNGTGGNTGENGGSGATGENSNPPTNLTTESPVTDTDSPQVQNVKNGAKNGSEENSPVGGNARPLSLGIWKHQFFCVKISPTKFYTQNLTPKFDFCVRRASYHFKH